MSDIVNRLRYEGPFYTLKNRRLRNAAADEIERLQAAATVNMTEALDRLEQLSARAWDRVGGGLMLMPERVAEYDEACRLARIALGRPLYGDNGEDEEQAADDADHPAVAVARNASA